MGECEGDLNSSDPVVPPILRVADLLDNHGRLSLSACLRVMFKNLRPTHVGLMHKALRKQLHARSDCSPPASASGLAESTHEVEHLFPMALPPRPSGLHRLARGAQLSPRRAKRLTNRITAWGITELLISFFNVFELSSPRGVIDWKACETLSPPSAYQCEGFRRLFLDVLSCVRLSPATSIGEGRGNLVLHNLLNRFIEKWPIDHNKEGASFTGQDLLVAAQAVEVDALRLPSRAAHLAPADYLDPEKGATFVDERARIAPSCDGDRPRPCYMVSPETEQRLRHRLIDSQMACLIPESKVARDSTGRLILNGLFAVHHKQGQRAIFDLRPANHDEVRLRWSKLPSGPMLSCFRLEPNMILRGSGDDLETYFYHWSEAESMIPRRAFGRKVTGEEAAELGGNPRETYRMALTALGMGGFNSPDICQELHENLLRSHGALEEANTIRHGRPLPRGSLMEGVYLDDHLCIGHVARAQQHSVTGCGSCMRACFTCSI